MMLSRKETENQRYTEDAESLLSHSDLEEHEEPTYTTTDRWASVRHTGFLIFTHFLVAGTAIWLWTHGTPNLDRKCSFHTSNYCKCSLLILNFQFCADLLQLQC